MRFIIDYQDLLSVTIHPNFPFRVENLWDLGSSLIPKSFINSTIPRFFEVGS